MSTRRGSWATTCIRWTRWRSRNSFVREAIDREYVIFFEHDPAIPAGIIRERQGRKFVEPVTD
jgi:hypothetical protein